MASASASAGSAAELDQRCIDTIRTLAIDAIEAPNSGHPGTVIGIAPVTYTLWQQFQQASTAARRCVAASRGQ